MFHRIKKQKPDYQTKSAKAYSALLRAMDKFVARAEPSCLNDFILVLDAYHEIPAKYWTPADKDSIAGTFLYIMQLFDELEDRVMREDNQEARDLIMQRFDKFIWLLKSANDSQLFRARVLIACARVTYANAMINDDSTAEEEQNIFDKYYQPAYDLLGWKQNKLLLLDDAMLNYVFQAQADLAQRSFCMGRSNLAIKLFFLALETLAEIQDFEDDSEDISHLFECLAFYLFPAPVVNYGKVTPISFLESVYAGSAKFYDFTCAASVMERQQPIDLLQLKFFVQGLRLVKQHFDSDDLPHSDFKQHMQEQYFQDVFSVSCARLQARLASVEGLTPQYDSLEIVMLQEVGELRLRVESLGSRLQEQGMFGKPVKRAKTDDGPERRARYNLRSLSMK